MAASDRRITEAPGPRGAPQRGYAMLVVVAVIAVASLAAIVDRLDAVQARSRRARDAAAALATAKAALLAYATSYRDLHAGEAFGYLPCPDADGSGVAKTPCGKAGETAVGLLPYKTLGLPDLRDAAGNCLWYAVSGAFKSNPKTSPMNWDSQGEIVVQSAAGTILAAPDDRRGGAAAVIVAPGPPLGAQRRGAAGGCGADAAQPDAYLENRQNAFTDGPVVDGAGTATANDRVAWIAPAEIFDRVVRRRDFAAYVSANIEAMRAKLGSQRAKADNALPANPFDRQADAYAFYEAWQDQFRYLRCAVAGCYTNAAGGRHDAVLLFGGRDAGGRPRPASARSVADYFESALPFAQSRRFDGCSSDPAAFDNTSDAGRAADIVACLAP